MSKFSLNTLGKLLADKSGLSQVEAELFIRKMFDVCNQGLEADKQVKIKWLGTFKVQATKDRESINVNTGERFTIEGRDKLTFTPDNILKEIVNKPFAQFETVVVNDGVDFDEIDEKFGEEQPEDAPSEVIDFLDEEEEAATPNPDVVVTEPEKEKEKEKEDEDELSKQIALEQAKLEKLKQAKLEQERIQKEKLEKEKQEQERLEQERLEQEKLEQERLKQEKLEQERLKQEKLEQERQKQEKLEQERLELAKQQQALKATVEPAVPATNETEEEDEETSNSHHIVIPRYLVVAVCLIVVALIGGMGWFAFNYGQMTAQRDHLAMQLSQYHQAPAKKAPANAVAAPLSQEQKLRQKAIEDSIRMAKTAEAVKLAEQSDEASDKAENAKQDEAKVKAKATAKEEDKVASKTESSAHYDKDVRVRTGAYRIVGVAQTVTVGAGQTLEQISNRYLGSGMECYVEALNGTGTVKAGQKIKIPKLELKKKKK